MPDMNDLHVFKSTSGGSDSGRGGGCSGNIFIWIVVIYVIITFIGKISG